MFFELCVATVRVCANQGRGSLLLQLHSLETMLSDAQYELQDKIRALAALQEKYDALDVFKLDKIARRLDGLRTVIGKAEYTQSQFDVSELQSAGDRQVVGGAMTNIREHLLSCKREVANVINECLTGTLKVRSSDLC